MTSSIDFWPKFGMAPSSDSDFWSSWPMVSTPARFRQLNERTLSSSSSIRMSLSGPAALEPLDSAAAVSATTGSRAVSSSTRSGSLKIARLLMRISEASRSAVFGSIAVARYVSKHDKSDRGTHAGPDGPAPDGESEAEAERAGAGDAATRGGE